MRNFTSSLPVPIIVVPEGARFIAASSHEFEILPVCHLVLVNLKSGNFDCVSFILVVPAKVSSISRKAEGCDAGGNTYHAVFDWRANGTPGVSSGERRGGEGGRIWWAAGH